MLIIYGDTLIAVPDAPTLFLMFTRQKSGLGFERLADALELSHKRPLSLTGGHNRVVTNPWPETS